MDTEYDWATNYADLDSKVKGILNLASSNMAAIYVINYDPNAWSLEVATYKLNLLWTGYEEAMKLLRVVDKGQAFVKEL